jgi:hypothetical protein
MALATAHNGGLSQVNLSDITIGGGYPFLNLFKGASQWVWAIAPSPDSPVDPSYLDTNGYPSVLANSGFTTLVEIPSQKDRPGNLCITWDGTGTIVAGAGGTQLGSCSFTGVISGTTLTVSSLTGAVELGQLVAGTGVATYTIIMAQLTGTTGGAGTYTVSVSQSLSSRSMTASGGSFSSSGGANAGFYASKNEGTSLTFKITAVGITNVKIFRVDDAALILAGETFGAKFKARMIEANYGVIRGMGWQSNNTTNLTTWRTRPPTTYFSYTADERRAEYFCGTTTNSGNNYSVGAPPTDSATGSAWSSLHHGTTVLVIFNVSATESGLCSLNVASTGAKNILSEYGTPLSTGGNSYPKGQGNNSLATLTYDSTLDAWVKRGGDNEMRAQGLIGGCPVEILLQLCAELGAHPWFVLPAMALDPPTDYTSSLATYVKNYITANNLTWMIPRFEGPNELWNTHTGFYNATLAIAKQSIFNGAKSVSGVLTSTDYSVSAFVYPSPGSGAGKSDITLSTTGNSFVVGSMVITVNLGGLTGLSTNAKVVAINVGGNANKITIDEVPSSGTYTSGGTVTPYDSDFQNWYGKIASMAGQDVATAFGIGNLGRTYHMIIGVQAAAATSSISGIWNDRFSSRSFVLNNSPPSGYTATPASNWFSHLCPATYIRPTLGNEQRELDLNTAFYGVEFVGSISSGTLTVDSITTNSPSTPALAVGMTVFGRGVGSPFSGVKIVSGSAPTWVLSSNLTVSSDTFYACRDPSAAISYVDLLNSGTSDFNLAGCYTIYQNWGTFARALTNSNGAAGRMCAYEGDYSPDYDSRFGNVQKDVFKYASKFAPNLAAYTIANYTNFVKAGGEYPSNLQPTGQYPSRDVWSTLETIYVTSTTPQWDAHVRWNQLRRATNLRIRMHG